MTSHVRVYSDGRLCVPAPVLKEAAQAAGKKKLPRSIWVGALDGEIFLTWDRSHLGSYFKTEEEAEEAARKYLLKEYDLSVRQRVLFGSYPKGRTFPVQVTSSGNIVIRGANTRDAVLRDRSPSTEGSTKGMALTLRAMKAKDRKSKKKSLKQTWKDMDHKVRLQVAAMLRKEYPEATVAEIARSLPDLTVAELVGQ